MHWILLLFIFSGPSGVAVDHIEFNTQQACLTAGNLAKDYSGAYVTKFVCAQKGIEP